MNNIRTIRDLEELLKKLSGFPKDTKIIFTDRFNEFDISNDYKYNCVYDNITIDCKKSGSVLEGYHRVLGGRE